MGSIFFGRMQKSTYFSMKCLICGYLSNSIVVVVIDASTDVCYQERNHSFHLAIQMNEKKKYNRNCTRVRGSCCWEFFTRVDRGKCTFNLPAFILFL